MKFQHWVQYPIVRAKMIAEYPEDEAFSSLRELLSTWSAVLEITHERLLEGLGGRPIPGSWGPVVHTKEVEVVSIETLEDAVP